MKLSILAGTLFALCALLARAEGQTASGLPPDMPQQELSQKVDAAVKDWKAGRRTFLSAPLVERADDGSRPVGALDYYLRFHERVILLLQPYASDPNVMVRQQISDFVRSDRSGPAVTVLAKLLINDDGAALDPLYHNYSQQELKQWGGSSLRNALFTDALRRGTGEHGNPSQREIYLLTIFLPDPQIHQYFQDLAQTGLYQTENYNFQGQMKTRRVPKTAIDGIDGFTPGRDPLSRHVDVALAADHNLDALNRLRDALQQATDMMPEYVSLDYQKLSPISQKDNQLRKLAGTNFDQVMFFVHSARFIHDKVLLREMIKLLQDTRDSGQGVGVMAQKTQAGNSRLAEFDPKNPDYQPLRVCDLALPALVESTGVDVGLPKLTAWLNRNPDELLYRGFTDDELNAASLKLTQALN